MKIKSFCTSNVTANREKSQPTEWEKIFVNHISDKQLIHRVYRELQLYNNRNNPPNNQFRSGLNTEQVFLQR